MSANMRSAELFPEAVEDYLKVETALGRMEGPFEVCPRNVKRVVSMGSVTKDSDGRVILDYSSPEGLSVNDGVKGMECALEHFDVGMSMLSGLPAGTKMIKVDVKAAFRLIPVREEDRPLLDMEWRGKYYIDRCLPFGLSTSPPLWERVSRALEWVIRKYVTNHVSHFVDDFLIAVPTGEDAEAVRDRVLALFAYLGVPVSIKKLIGPTTRLEFLGVQVDSMKRLCEVAPAKQAELIRSLRKFHHSWTVSLKLLESTVGLLQFVTGVVRPGKAFIARLRHSMYTAFTRPYLELAAILVAIRSWSKHLVHKTVVVYSDCKPAVEAACRAYSPTTRMMSLIREIVLLSLQHQFTTVFIHIPNTTNLVADTLSRFSSPVSIQTAWPCLSHAQDKAKSWLCSF